MCLRSSAYGFVSNAAALWRACAFLSAMGHLNPSGKRSDTGTFRVAEEISGQSFPVAILPAEGAWIAIYACQLAVIAIEGLESNSSCNIAVGNC